MADEKDPSGGFDGLLRSALVTAVAVLEPADMRRFREAETVDAVIIGTGAGDRALAAGARGVEGRGARSPGAVGRGWADRFRAVGELFVLNDKPATLKAHV